MMDSGSESEDEVFFGPVTEKEMTVRNLRGINEEERSVDNEGTETKDLSTGKENICSSHSFVDTTSHIMEQADVNHMSDEEICTESPAQQKSELSESNDYDTLSQECHVTFNQSILCESTISYGESNVLLTSSLESNFKQFETVNGYQDENLRYSECLSVSITDAIRDSENEYGEFDNTLKSIEELENSFTQVALGDVNNTGHLPSVEKETKNGNKVDSNSENDFRHLMTPDESKNEYFIVSEENKPSELLNKTCEVLFQESPSSKINDSIRVTCGSNQSVNHVQNINTNQNEFDSNPLVLSKTAVETISSDSNLSFKTCHSISDDAIISTKTSESTLSEIQSNSSSNTLCSLVLASDQAIQLGTEKDSDVKQNSDTRITSDVLCENMSLNNSQLVTDLQTCFNESNSSSKAEKVSSHTSGLSGSFTTDLKNMPLTTECERIIETYDLKAREHVKIKNSEAENNSVEILYSSQSQKNQMQICKNNVINNRNGITDSCNLENNNGTEIKLYNHGIVTVESTEASKSNSLDVTAKENEPASKDENMYIFETTETSIKENKNCELTFEVIQKTNDETISEPNMCERESFKDLLDEQNNENMLEMNERTISEYVTTCKRSLLPQPVCEVINTEFIETDLEVPSNPVILKPKTENTLINTWSSETYGTSSNENLCTDKIFSSLSEESCKNDNNLGDLLREICTTSNENVMTESHSIMTDVIVSMNDNICEVKDNSLSVVSVSLNENLSLKSIHSSHGITDLTKPFFKNIHEEESNLYYTDTQKHSTSLMDENIHTDVVDKESYLQDEIQLNFSNYDEMNEPQKQSTSVKDESILAGVSEKSFQGENLLDFSNYNKIDETVANEIANINHEEVTAYLEDSGTPDVISHTEIKQTTERDVQFIEQEKIECEEEPMDISYGDLSIKNIEQWKEYRHTIELDSSLLGDIITETEFKEVLDSEEASFNLARSVNKSGDKCVPNTDLTIASNFLQQKSNVKKCITNSASKAPKQQKSVIKTPSFVPETKTLSLQRKWASNLVSTKPSATDKNRAVAKVNLISEKARLQKPSTAPKSGVSSITREPKSQSKPKQEHTVIPTVRRSIELTKPASSPNNLKRNERFKQIESPIRAYINNSPSSVASKMSSHSDDNKNLLENKIPKQEFGRSSEKKVSHIPKLRTPRLQVQCSSIQKRKVDTTENVDPNRGSHKTIPRVKESPYSKLPRYNDKCKSLSSTPVAKPLKTSERDDVPYVLQDKANYSVRGLQASPNKE